jgi:hypothetical protein
MVSDHTASDRNNDGYDSPEIWNDLMTNNGIQSNPFGIIFDLVSISQTTTNIPNLPADPILHGVMGDVTSAMWSAGTTMTISPSANSSVIGTIYKTGVSFGNTNVMFAYASYGNGRVAAIGDSSPCDDGSGDNNDVLYDGWIADAGGNHERLIMNATIWLASSASAPTLNVTPSNQNVTASAGNTSYTVTSGSAWTASSNQSWCTVTPSGTGNGTITATYAQNTTTASRSASVTVTVTGLTPVVVTVTQAVPTLSVSPSNQNVAVSSGTTNYTVASNSAWTASSNQAWCTVTPSGTGNGTIIATYTQNNTATARTANITVLVSGATTSVVTVTQAAPTLSVTPSNQGVSATSGSTSFAVTSNSSWTSVSNKTWCTISSSGTGNGSITVNYDLNTTSLSRTANITVAVTGLTPVVVTVTQEAPALSVSPTNLNVASLDSIVYYAVTSNTDWEANSDQSWCSITPVGSGNENLEATYSMNTGTSARIATITLTALGVSPVIVTLTQAANLPTLSVTPSNQSVTASAGSTAFNVYTGNSWTAVSDQVWCSVTPSGTGNGIITATYALNSIASARVANITITVPGISPVVVTVTQAASVPAEFLYTMANDVQTSDYTFEFDLLLLDNDPSQPFELATIQGGIYVNPAIYNGGTITASIVPGTSTLYASQQPTSVTFTQSANIIKLASKAPPGTGSGTIVSTNPAAPNRVCRLKLTNSNAWATAQPNLTFNFNNTPYATKLSQYLAGINTPCTLNTTNSYSVCGNNVLNPPPSLSVTPANQSVANTPGNTSFIVTANRGWTASSDQAWCTVTSSGYGNGTITAVFSANTTSVSRIANITVTVTGLPVQVVTVTQEGESNRTLNLTLFLEGLYIGSGTMHPAMDESGVHWGATVADKITIELRDVTNYSSLVYSASNVNLSTSGLASVQFPAAHNGSYYIVIRHRNSILTVSANPVSFAGSFTAYAFDNGSKAFGANMLLKGDGTWVIYGGDTNQDGLVDSSDMLSVDNDATNFATGYIANDVNGDGLIDAGDMILLDNNASSFIGSVTP